MTEDAIPLFLSFCIEEYKNMKSISGEQAMKILSETGTLEYLSENYEIIHTQSPQWIREEVDEYVNKKLKS